MLDIRYLKLNFKLQITDDCILPEFKASALRGGMGGVLIENYCIGNENCKQCGFLDNCNVQNIMNPQLKVDIPFLSKGGTASPGFIIGCYDYRKEFKKNDILDFELILFGKMITYLPQFIYAFEILGNRGIGTRMSKFILIQVNNEDRNKIYDKGRWIKENIIIYKVHDYVKKTRPQVKLMKGIEFMTPFRLVKCGKLVDDISFQDIISSISRRLAILNGLEDKLIDKIITGEERIESYSELNWIDIERYSNRQRTSMKLGGVVGRINIGDIPDKYADYIAAGELIHIGKNTTFGLGKYIVY